MPTYRQVESLLKMTLVGDYVITTRLIASSRVFLKMYVSKA